MEATADLEPARMERHFRAFRRDVPWPVRLLFRGRPVVYVVRGRVARVLVVDLWQRAVREEPAVDDAVHPLQIHLSAYILKECLARKLFLYLGISKRVKFRCRRADRKYLLLLEHLFNMHECGQLPLRRMLAPAFLRAWLPRWREILLYARITADKAVGRPFRMADHLPTGPRRRGRASRGEPRRDRAVEAAPINGGRGFSS